MTTKVVWNLNGKFVPGVGTPEKGSEVLINTLLAYKLIRQKVCSLPAAKHCKTREKN